MGEDTLGAGCLASCFTIRLWKSVALGQVISLLVAGTGVCNQFLASNGFDAPITQNSLNYLMLSCFLWWKIGSSVWRGGRLRRASQDTATLLAIESTAATVPVDAAPRAGKCPEVLGPPWWTFLLLALIDVEANFVVTLAYQYTSITSVMLLDCLGIPFSMALLWMNLGMQFNWKHALGALVCVGGIVALVAGDVVQDNSSAEMPQKWIGDLFCVLSSFLYATSNVLQEATVRRYGKGDYLGGIGAYGALVAGLQLLAFSQDEIPSWSLVRGWMVLPFLGYPLCLFAMYNLTARFLEQSDAAVFNLSLLTSDLWAILASLIFFQQPVGSLYWLALFLVVVGFTVYHSAPEPVSPEGCSSCLLDFLWLNPVLPSPETSLPQGKHVSSSSSEIDQC
jgi:solute carrier family 35, member F1/2